MLSLDIRTLSFLAMISSLLLAMGLQIANRIIVKDPSLRLWTLGASANGAAYILFALRDIVPDLLSIVAGNTLLVVGSAWLYLGNRRFRELENEAPWYWVLAATTAAVLYYFTYLAPSLAGRIVTLSAAMATILLPSALLLALPGDSRDRITRWMIAAAYFVTALFLCVRAALTLFMDSPGENFMAVTNPIHTLAVVFGIGTNVILGIGLPLLVSGRMQQRLERLLTQQNAMLGNELVGIVTVRNRTIVWANPAFEKMFGYDRGELVGMPTRKNYPSEETYLAFGAAAYQSLSSGKAFRSESEHVRKDGSHIWVDVSGAILDPESGESLWAFVDITERKQAEKILQASQERLRLILDYASDGIYGTDTNGICTFVNKAALRILGYEHEEELVGKGIHALIHHTYPDGRPYPKEECHVRLSTLAGKTTHVENEVHWRRDGTSFPVEYRSRPMYRSGVLVGAVVSFIDITARKQAEAELEQHRHHLEELVFSRTAELAQARDAAEAANRAKSVFLANMSHELRTPMNGIMGMTNLVLRRATDPQQIDWLNKSLGAAQHLLTVINDIL
ncbi:MAG: PAS domain S-box protein, partial [Rhodocyclales bacterium]|nr:PAS domain S-box protein [Rhodocyclales bacterium]